MDVEDGLRRFNDKNGRIIEIRFDFATLDATAFDGSKQIGFMEFKLVENDFSSVYVLNYPEVDPAYQRAGIAAAMLQFAYEALGCESIQVGGPKDNGRSGENARTPEGEAFVRYGIKKGWLVDPYEEGDCE